MAGAPPPPAGDRRPDAAIAFAIATGVMIAGYTSLDRVGTRLIEPFQYATILWVSGAVLLVVWVRFVAGGGLCRGGPEQNRRAVVGGVLTLCLPVDPVRPERGASYRGRAAAGVGDGHRGHLGRGPAG